MVLDQHRRPPPQQIPPLQLWILLPHLSNNVPHVRLRRPQLHLHHLPQARPRPARQIPLPIPPNRHPQRRLLRLRRRRQHLPQIPASLLQSGRRRYHAVFHRNICVSHDTEARGLGYVYLPRSRGGWGRHC